jgi:hypothetical protein
MRRGAESTLEHATSTLANHADTVSDESEGATPDRHTIRHSVEDAPDALPSTPERPTLDDGACQLLPLLALLALKARATLPGFL